MSFKDFIIILNEEIKFAEVELSFSNDDKDSLNIDSKKNTESIISNEERLKYLQNQLDNVESKTTDFMEIVDIVDQIKSEMNELIEQQQNNDINTNSIGDEKTFYENDILKISNYKRKCLNLIETIESKIESPDDEEITEEDVKGQLKKLNDQAYLLFNIEDVNNPISIFIKNGYSLKGIKLIDENESY